MFDFTTQRPQLMMLAGIILLGWVLMRRQVKYRGRSRREERRQHKAAQTLAKKETKGVPLADAPVETLRWQAELFELQRELKAELETKIRVVQSLLRQADQRIARLDEQAGRPTISAAAEPPSLTQADAEQIENMAAAGFKAEEIADRWGLSLETVQRSLSAEATSAPTQS